MAKPSHLLIIGKTQSGKTYFANGLHRTFPKGGLSIFINTNHADVWGFRCHTFHDVLKAVQSGERYLNVLMPEDHASQVQLLAEIQAAIFRWGAKGKRGVWCQIIVDEAQEFSRETMAGSDPVRVIATRGLGAYGVRLVAITQYPVALNTTTRTNLDTVIIFAPGREGLNFIRQKWSDKGEVELIEEWTRQPYHFILVRGAGELEAHPPVK